MTIRASLHDFFAYTLPGVFYLLVGAYSVFAFGLASLDLDEIQNISLVAALVLLGLGYLIGIVMDTLAEYWHRLFNPDGLKKPAYESLATVNPHFAPVFGPSEWAIALAHLRVHASDLAIEIDRFSAYRHMLRNVSLGFLLLGIVNVAAVFVSDWPSWVLIAAATAALTLAISAGRKAAEFGLWYYRATFAGVVGCGIRTTDLFSLVAADDLGSDQGSEDTPPSDSAAPGGRREVASQTGEPKPKRPSPGQAG